jgi:hypothetical protein
VYHQQRYEQRRQDCGEQLARALARQRSDPASPPSVALFHTRPRSGSRLVETSEFCYSGPVARLRRDLCTPTVTLSDKNSEI